LSKPAVSLAATSEEAVERERFLGLPITPLQRTYVPLPAPSTARSTGFEDGRVDGGTGLRGPGLPRKVMGSGCEPFATPRNGRCRARAAKAH
jgi:hypothetical protein